MKVRKSLAATHLLYGIVYRFLPQTCLTWWVVWQDTLRIFTRFCIYYEDQLCTVWNYARNFGNAAKEGLKGTTQWVAYYFTNPKSWYPVPERTTILPYRYSNVITCTDSTTEHTEDEGLSANIWCSSASNGKSWNSPVAPRSERNSAVWTAQLRNLWL